MAYAIFIAVWIYWLWCLGTLLRLPSEAGIEDYRGALLKVFCVVSALVLLSWLAELGEQMLDRPILKSGLLVCQMALWIAAGGLFVWQSLRGGAALFTLPLVMKRHGHDQASSILKRYVDSVRNVITVRCSLAITALILAVPVITLVITVIILSGTLKPQ